MLTLVYMYCWCTAHWAAKRSYFKPPEVEAMVATDARSQQGWA
jgi:hypothetical protein